MERKRNKKLTSKDLLERSSSPKSTRTPINVEYLTKQEKQLISNSELYSRTLYCAQKNFYDQNEHSTHRF